MKAKLMMAISSLLLFSGTCLYTAHPSAYGWTDGDCIDTGRCVPLE